jgi:membrane protein YdbS with pleckstrin-like domain
MTDAPPPDPDQRLAGSALAAWMLGGAGWGVAAIVLATTALDRLVPGCVALAAAGAFAVASTVVVPVLRFRTWRYAVREEEIDLRHGAWVIRRTIVPMARVQHVDTTRTPLGQLFGLATLTVHTAAGKHEVPGLDIATADRLRDEIARRARVPDDV